MENLGRATLSTFILLSLSAAVHGETAPKAYGLIIDAGSSGSRIRVHEWQQSTGLELPKITEIYDYKIHPGIASFSHDLSGLEPYMNKLVSEGKNKVPAASHSNTSIYLMATAGMRLLLEDRANDVIDKIDSILSDPTVNPFHYEHTNTRILSGEEEGVFAWISVNYLRGFFHDDDDEMDSVGILEMGGASIQIAFIPDGSILADKFPVKIAGVNYPLYVHSYLYYGQEYAERWAMEYQYKEGSTITDYPCFPRGANAVRVVDGKNITFKGTGDWEACYNIFEKHVYKVDDDLCYPKPCAIGTTYQPSIGDEKKFIATSAFYLGLEPIEGAMKDDGTMVPEDIAEAGKVFCNTTVHEPYDPFLPISCMQGAYIPILLTKGFGFNNSTKQVMAKLEINGQPSEWTLGAIIYENERKDWECPVPPSGASTATITMSTIFATLILLLGNAA